MTPKNVYTLLTVLCFLGWGWLLLSIFLQKHEVGVTVCMSKHITDIPCPSCGTTRSVVSFFRGDFFQSLYLNPLGVITALGLLVLPFMLLFDWFSGKKTVYSCYKKTENILKKPQVYLPLLVLIILNWIWNIHKGL